MFAHTPAMLAHGNCVLGGGGGGGGGTCLCLVYQIDVATNVLAGYIAEK